jgi:hypothetical protein
MTGAAARPPDDVWAGLDFSGPGETPPFDPWTAPLPKKSGPRIGAVWLILLFVCVLAVAGLGALLYTVNSEKGQVMFTTTDPNGGNGCVVLSRVTTVPRGTHAWMVAMFAQPVDDRSMSVEVAYNGAVYWSYTWPPGTGKGAMCTWEPRDLAYFPRGSFTFTFIRGGAVEMSGTLTIT